MPIITIHGPLGSGAPEIGQCVAQRLGGQYIDREITTSVAARLERAVSQIEDVEQPPGTWLGRLLQWLTPRVPVVHPGGMGPIYLPGMDPPLSHVDYLDALTSVINGLAWIGNIVIHGHGSQFVLKNHPRAFHVMTLAPLGLRIARVRKRLKMDGEAARKELKGIDRGQRAFASRYFRAALEDPGHYDLVINANSIDFEGAAQLIIDALTFHWGSQKLAASN